MKKNEPLESKTVLVVDDASLNRKLIRTLLGLRNIQVIEAEDGEQALKLTRERQPDLVLMDLQLPGMNGLEATEALKADGQTAHIPVVILSAGSLAADQQRLGEAGCAGLIQKPFAAEEFLTAVTSYLE